MSSSNTNHSFVPGVNTSDIISQQTEAVKCFIRPPVEGRMKHRRGTNEALVKEAQKQPGNSFFSGINFSFLHQLAIQVTISIMKYILVCYMLQIHIIRAYIYIFCCFDQYLTSLKCIEIQEQCMKIISLAR